MTGPELHGIGWGHPRCSVPLDEAARQWAAEGRGIVQWTYRSLAEFNSAPLDSLVDDFDLLVIDHPMVPRYASLLLPLDALPSLQHARSDFIGQTGTLYQWGGVARAVPVDVAVHVSARRPDLLAELDEPCPTDWPAVLRLAERHPGQVVASLTGDDAVCILITIAASAGSPVSAQHPPDIGAVETLVDLAERCAPECTQLRPPGVLDLLYAGKAAYTPALFGYATYLRPPAVQLAYGSVPAWPEGTAAGIMGGAGLAASAATRHPETALAFIDWISSSPVQRDALAAAGGQPAARILWNDPAADAELGGFLTQTRQATERATIRPRHPRWPEFQNSAANVLATALAGGWRPAAVHAALSELHADVFATHGGDPWR